MIYNKLSVHCSKQTNVNFCCVKLPAIKSNLLNYIPWKIRAWIWCQIDLTKTFYVAHGRLLSELIFLYVFFQPHMRTRSIVEDPFLIISEAYTLGFVTTWSIITWYCRDLSVYVSSQWEMALQCNAISHWLDAYTRWSLILYTAQQLLSNYKSKT